MAATNATQLMRHDVYHLPGGCPSYACGRVVIVGDAAHAMLPTMGQGAATALEDGACVGRLIAAPVTAGGDLAAAARITVMRALPAAAACKAGARSCF